MVALEETQTEFLLMAACNKEQVRTTGVVTLLVGPKFQVPSSIVCAIFNYGTSPAASINAEIIQLFLMKF